MSTYNEELARSGRGYVGKAEIRAELFCACCGEPLQMKAGVQLPEIVRMTRETGATSNVFIVPCQNCIDRELGPARALLKAIEGINALKGKP